MKRGQPREKVTPYWVKKRVHFCLGWLYGGNKCQAKWCEDMKPTAKALITRVGRVMNLPEHIIGIERDDDDKLDDGSFWVDQEKVGRFDIEA